MKYLLFFTLLLSGCGMKYITEAYIDGEKKVEAKSSVPAKVTIEGDKVEVDQRSSESWWEKLLPAEVNIEK